jgi:hypothetical protein
MALHKLIEIDGKVIVQTSMGSINNGTQRLSFLAYIKVISITGDKNLITATVQFSNDETQFIKQYQIPMSVENGAENFIKQSYKHLKTLPDFVNAIDC